MSTRTRCRKCSQTFFAHSLTSRPCRSRLPCCMPCSFLCAGRSTRRKRITIVFQSGSHRGPHSFFTHIHRGWTTFLGLECVTGLLRTIRIIHLRIGSYLSLAACPSIGHTKPPIVCCQLVIRTSCSLILSLNDTCETSPIGRWAQCLRTPILTLWILHK